MNNDLRRMTDLIRAIEQIVGTGFKVAGLGSEESQTYCIVITSRDNPDMLAMMEATRMITDGVLMTMRSIAAQECASEAEEEVIKH